MADGTKQTLRRVLLPAFLLLALALLLHGNGRVGLFESSEARYAEVAREMVATGDYLSPQIDYVYHFTKPPLTYWITAVGYHIFGENTFGARFFLALAALLVLFLTALIYRRSEEGDTGVLAAAVLLCSLEFFLIAKILTTDMFLTLWIVAGFYLWSLRESERLGPRSFALLFGIDAALAFMTKGPVPLLFWAVVLIPYAVWKDRGRSLKPFLSPLAWGSFVLLALPWFVAVGLKHPGLLDYLVTHESAQAAYSARRFHPGPWYYYAPVFLAGFFPWWIALAARWKRLKEPRFRLWVLWAVVPVLVWSFFPAKLPTYILPTFPAWALLTAAVLKGEKGRGRVLWTILPASTGLVAGACVYAFINSSRFSTVGAPVTALFVLAAAAGLAGAAFGLAGRSRKALAAVLVAVISVEAALPVLCVDMETAVKIRRRMGTTLADLRSPGEAVLEYHVTIFSIPFYIRDKVAAYENNFFLKKYREDLPPHALRNEKQLRAYLKTHPRLWVVTDTRWQGSMEKEIPDLHFVMRQGNHTLWATDPVCERLRTRGIMLPVPPPEVSSPGG
jgi:4-amino-4-deoxy-L-arabinose transferase